MQRKFDVLIAGAGIAGLMAATKAHEANPNASIALLQASAHGAGGCSWKTHGINAAMNPSDSPEMHYVDTLRGGGMIGNPELAKVLCSDVPKHIEWLTREGVPFDHHGSDFKTGYYGGSTTARSIHAKDMAGRIIVDLLCRKVMTQGIYVFERRNCFHLHLDDDGVARGVSALNLETNRVETFGASEIVLATGGGACVYPIATINSDKVAGGIIMSLEVGAELIDMEMVQFHPTGLNRPGTIGHGEIMEEELRSMGAKFFNAAGERYMPKYDERAERATRDIVARGSYMEIRAGRGTENGGVLFDLSAIDRKDLAARFPYMVKRFRDCGVDLLTQSVIETSPAAHFLMGGLRIGADTQTSIRGLRACGEDAGGIHGGNRLGGNGVADALVFGAAAGHHAATAAGTGRPTSTFAGGEVNCYVGLTNGGIKEIDSAIKSLMWSCAGPVRSASDLRNAENGLLTIRETLSRQLHAVPVQDYTQENIAGRELHQKLMLGLLIVRSALVRGNSVGAHYRTDADGDQQIYNTVARIGKDGLPVVEKRFRPGTMAGALNPAEAA